MVSFPALAELVQPLAQLTDLIAETVDFNSDSLVLVVAKDHPLASEKSVPFTRTLDYDHVRLHEASAIHAFLRQVCSAVHRTLRMRIEVSNFETACRMIEADIGVGIVPGSSARRRAERLAICIVPLEDAWSLRQQFVVVRQLEALPPFGRDLVNVLVEDARRAVGAQSALQAAPSQSSGPS